MPHESDQSQQLSADARQTFSVEIEMLSDWHVGQGSGRQHVVDALVARDDDDLPYIPASTLRGIWRDAAEQLAFGLDNGQDSGPWAAFVALLFGTQTGLDDQQAPADIVAPRASLLSFTAARLPEPQRVLLRGDGAGQRALREALTFIKPGVAIDPRSGMAKDDFLRFDEVAIGGMTFEACGYLKVAGLGDEIDQRLAKAVLMASAQLIERLGAKRRRGLGRCKVAPKFDDMTLDEACDFLAAHAAPAPNKRQSEPESVAAAYSYGDGSRAEQCQRLLLKIDLLSPLIIPDETLGNVVTTQLAVPGSMLLPLVARAARRVGLAQVDSHISSGRLRVLPGTIGIGTDASDARSLPLPLCWEAPKVKTGRNGNMIRCAWHADAEDQTQYKSLRRGFVISADGQSQLVPEPRLELRTHNVIEDLLQRPTSAVGGVFSYEVISAGQSFMSELILPYDKAMSDAMAKTLEGEHWIGRGKQAGYGHIWITALNITQDAVDDRLAGPLPEQIDVWLTSDLLLSNDILETATDLTAIEELLAQAIGEGASCQIVEASLRTKRINSWHRGWGLPRPTLVVVQAGSALRVEFENVADLSERLRRIEMNGLGERRAEGFGAVLFNHSLIGAPGSIKPQRPGVVGTPIPGANQMVDDEAAQKAAEDLKDVAQRAWEAVILTRAEIAASDIGKDLIWSGQGAPTASQLGLVRAMIAGGDSLATIDQWLYTLKAKNTKSGRNESGRAKWSSGAINKFKEFINLEKSDVLPVWVLLGVSWREDNHGVAEDSENAQFAAASLPTLAPSDNSALHEFAVRAALMAAARHSQSEVRAA